MAGDGEHEIVVRGIHHLDLGAKRGPERAERFNRGGVRIGRRREDAPAPFEQGGKACLGPALFGAGDRVRGDHHAFGQDLLQNCEHAFLGRTDIADDRFSGHGIGHRQRGHAHRANGHAQDDEIGALDCFGRGRADGVDQFAPLRGEPDMRIGIVARGLEMWRLLADREPDRAAQKAEPDDRDPLDRQQRRMLWRFLVHAAASCALASARSVSAIACMSASWPIVMRRWSGRPWPGRCRTA